MRARLYGMRISHPAHAARLMLEHKGIEHETVDVTPGQQAVRMRLLGFRGGTVPALRIDGRRVTGSRAIARVLDEVRPDPPLFPRDPARRAAVEEAERWGEEVLQPVPRRLLRWALRHRPELRVWFLQMLRQPMPELTARAMGPVTAFYARREDARSTERIKADWLALPGHLEHVDGLLADGVVGSEEPNAADYQIGTTLRLMLACEDYRPLVEGRPAEAFARRIWPEYPVAVPSLLPDELRSA